MTIQYRSAKLENGLELHAECDPDAESAAVGIFVRTGARDEPKGLMGVSHFLEHMMFKGSATHNAHEINEAFDQIGARNNAFTSHELTAYHAHVLPEHFTKATTLVFDLLRPALRQEDFDSERGVILEEIAMYDDNPAWVAYERANDAFYKGHPLGVRVLGTPESINAMTKSSMREYFTKRYSPDNSLLVAAGRVDFDALVEQARLESQCWKRSVVSREHPTWAPHTTSLTVPQEKATRAYTVLLWPSCPVRDPRRYAAVVCSQILGDSDGSRLYWALVEPGIAVDASTGYSGRDGVGEIAGSVVCSTEDMVRAEEIFVRECHLLRDSLTEDDLVRARRKIATGVAMAGESSTGRMQRLGAVMASTAEYTTLEEELARVNALSIDDLRGYLTDFPFEPMTIVRVVPTSTQTLPA
ncbi:MAG: insulinase family protein [Phycisphaerales bacterium]|nr:insulinase family protein [Phycisphaerales bacterium]